MAGEPPETQDGHRQKVRAAAQPCRCPGRRLVESPLPGAGPREALLYQLSQVLETHRLGQKTIQARR